MSDNANLSDGAVSSMELDVLSEMVERQLDDVAGGGYSQFTVWHNKTVDPTEPTVPTVPSA